MKEIPADRVPMEFPKVALSRNKLHGPWFNVFPSAREAENGFPEEPGYNIANFCGFN